MMEASRTLILIGDMGELDQVYSATSPSCYIVLGHPAWVSKATRSGLAIRTIADLSPGRWLEVSFALSPPEQVAFFCAIALSAIPEGTNIAWASGQSRTPSARLTGEHVAGLRRVSLDWLKMAEMGLFAELGHSIRSHLESRVFKAFRSVRNRSLHCAFPMSFSNGKVITLKDRAFYRALAKSERSLIANPFSVPKYFESAEILERRVSFLLPQVFWIQVVAVTSCLPGVRTLVERWGVLRRKLKNL
jgi:hypothetical protein